MSWLAAFLSMKPAKAIMCIVASVEGAAFAVFDQASASRAPRERPFHGPATGEWQENPFSLKQPDDFDNDIMLFSCFGCV